MDVVKILRRDGGFSLVELIIVIALSGLILLIVFLGLNQANTTRKDQDRKDDAGRYLTTAQAWVSDNNGVLPSNQTDVDSITATITGGAFTTPGGTTWAPKWGTGTPSTAAPDYNQILISAQAKCTGASISANSASDHTRQIAVAVLLTGGQSYCVFK